MDNLNPWGAPGFSGADSASPPSDSYSANGLSNNRSSLGQFIERSTSAPPVAPESFRTDNAYRGEAGSLDRITKAYDNLSLSSGDVLGEGGSSTSWNSARQGNYSYVQTAGIGKTISRPVSVNSRDFDPLSPGSNAPAASMVRSHSAAPSYGPPPGIPGRIGDDDVDRAGLSPRPGGTIRRPASTSVPGYGSADYGAQRSVMGLIGEETPAGDYNRSYEAISMQQQQQHSGDLWNNIAVSGTTGRSSFEHNNGHNSQQQMYARAGPGQPIPVDLQNHVYLQKQNHHLGNQTPVHSQVLMNGQPVYVNANPEAAAHMKHQGQTILQPQPHMIQRDASGRQYVSVLPYQGGNQNQQAIGGLPPTHSGRGSSSFRMESGGSHQSYGRHGKERGRGGGGRRASRRSNDQRSSAQTSYSPLLDEFRASKSREWTAFQIEGHVVEFCQDQNGSRFIQQRLEMGDVAEQQVVMREVLPAIRRLRNDVFGNYVVQKLLDFGTDTMKADIRDTLEGEMLQLSLQMYGCRVVQKALEALAEDDLSRLLAEFHHNVLSCIHDQNGNHVIQKCIEVISSRSNKAEAMGDLKRANFLSGQVEFIVNDVLVNAPSLSCHPYGCRVLQRILEHCEKNKKNEVLDEIRAVHRKLLDDQYGNYVIQHVLQFGRSSDRDSLLGIIVENGLLTLSRQKFASNVVEKLLKYGNGTQRRAIVREMLKKNTESSPMNGPSGVNSVALLMVRDAYANYVVQTTLDVVPESEEKRLLLEELNAHSEELRNYTFAKHIVTKLAALNSS